MVRVKCVAVTDLHYEELEVESESTLVEDDHVTSHVSMTVLPSTRMVRVKCVAFNEVGYVEETSQDYLSYNPDSVTLDGPSTVIAGEEAVFSCASEDAFPAPLLMWTLDSQDVTTDAEQIDNQELVESGGGVSSLSKLRVNPTMGGHTHVVKCFVAGTDISTDFYFYVEDLFEEDTYEDADAEYMDEKAEFEEEYEDDEGNYIYEDQDYKEEEEHSEYANNDHISEVEEERDYNFDSNFNESQLEIRNDMEEHKNEEDYYDYNEEEYDEYDYDGEDHNNGGDEYIQNYDNNKEDIFKHEIKDTVDAVEQQVYEEKTDKKEAYYIESDATEYDENNEQFKENVENEKGHYENKASEYKEVNEEIFDATQQQQSFAAAEPGSAVLSHDSDPSTHVSADMFSPKPLYGSSERVCCGTALILVTICNLIRLLS